jgi:Septum formation initiator
MLGCFLLLVIAALAANYGPFRHYQDARARLEKTAADVASLEEQKAALLSELGKLNETGYLEGLARQELTYARPDEELYIVTGLPGGDSSAPTAEADRADTGGAAPAPGTEIGAALPSVAVGATTPGFESATTLGIGASLAGGSISGSGGAPRAGLLERIMSAIGGIF